MSIIQTLLILLNFFPTPERLSGTKAILPNTGLHRELCYTYKVKTGFCRHCWVYVGMEGDLDPVSSMNQMPLDTVHV